MESNKSEQPDEPRSDLSFFDTDTKQFISELDKRELVGFCVDDPYQIPYLAHELWRTKREDDLGYIVKEGAVVELTDLTEIAGTLVELGLPVEMCKEFLECVVKVVVNAEFSYIVDGITEEELERIKNKYLDEMMVIVKRRSCARLN